MCAKKISSLNGHKSVYTGGIVTFAEEWKSNSVVDAGAENKDFMFLQLNNVINIIGFFYMSSISSSCRTEKCQFSVVVYTPNKKTNGSIFECDAI